MKKVLFILFALSLVLPSAVMGKSPSADRLGSEIVYDVRPVAIGAELYTEVYFLDLVSLRSEWLNQAGDAAAELGEHDGPKATNLIKNFDAILAKGLAQWVAAIGRYHFQVVSVVPVCNNSNDPRTTGLIIFVKQEIAQSTQR